MLVNRIVEALLDEPLSLAPPDLPEPIAPKPFDPQPFETADLAAEYIEGEVGRFDWQHNWPKHKENSGSDLGTKVADWLRHYEVDHDPAAIVNYLDDLLARNPEGKWT